MVPNGTRSCNIHPPTTWAVLIATIAIIVAGGGWVSIIDRWILGVSYPVPDILLDGGRSDGRDGSGRGSGRRSGSIVISGTSSGIGRATCGFLAERYPTVTLYCGVRNVETASGHPFDLPNVRTVLLDVTNDDHVRNVMDRVESPLLAVVSNAGMADLGTIECQSRDVIERHYQVNVLGGLRLIRSALPLLRSATAAVVPPHDDNHNDQRVPPPGRIVIVSSASALIAGYPKWGAYQSSKAALEILSDVLRRELAPQQISVSVIEPGFIVTPLVEKALDHWAGAGAGAGAEEGAAQDDDAAQDANVHPVSMTEQELYPHLFDPKLIEIQTKFMSYGGSMEETCQAIDHAITSPHPRTRYLTSRMSLLPTSIFVGLVNALPTDRLSDWFFANMQLQGWAAQLQPLQAQIIDVVAASAAGRLLQWVWNLLARDQS